MTKFFSNGCYICKIILLYLNSIADLVIQNLSKIINVSYELVQTFWHACKTNLHLENLLDIRKPHAYTVVHTVSGCLPSFCYYRSEFQAELMQSFDVLSFKSLNCCRERLILMLVQQLTMVN